MKRIFSSLQDRTVMITGASSGLGEMIAYEAAKEGARLVLCARRKDRLEAVAQNCVRLFGATVDIIELDVANYENCQKGLELIKATHPVIDVLANCAGKGVFTLALETSYETTRDTFAVNVLGLMHVTQQIALQMVENGAGHIINIASQAGKMATPKSSTYSASKFAVLGFSNSLRLELKPLNIAVTTVNPGPIRTPFFGLADPSGNYLARIDRWILEPDQLAKRIVSKMGTTTREINAPFLMELGSKGYQLFPKVGDYLASTIFNKK